MLKEISNVLSELKPHLKSQISFRILDNNIHTILEVYSNDGMLHKEEMVVSLEATGYTKVEQNAIESMLFRVNGKI